MSAPARRPLVRVMVVDDHPALRAGLEAVLDDAADIVPVGAADGELTMWPLLRTTTPDVVVLDHQMPGLDGLHLCRRIKDQPPAPRVLVYSAYASAELEVAAAVAGADAVMSKGVPARVLVEAVRAVAASDAGGLHVAPPALRRAAHCLQREDLPVVGMLLEGTAAGDVCATLGIDHAELVRRVDRIIAALADCATPH